MIDWVSLSAIVNGKELLSDGQIAFKHVTDGETGEHLCSIANMRNLSLRLSTSSPSKLHVRNSLHKFWHGDNAGDFNIEDLRGCIKRLENELHIDATETRIQSVEFGVNVAPSAEVSDVWRSYLHYRTTPFVPLTNKGGQKKSWGVGADLSDFKVKCYDKSKEYNLGSPILRFEIGVRKMRWLRNTCQVPLLYLSQLAQEPILGDLGRVLLEIYDQVFKVEHVDTDTLRRLKPSDRDLLRQGRNAAFWEEERRANRNTAASRMKRFRELQDEFKTGDTHSLVRRLIEEKISNLTTPSSCAISRKFTTSEHLNPLSANTGFHANSPLVNRVSLRELRDSLKGLTERQHTLLSQRRCIICEKDISSLRRDAKTCGRVCRNLLSNPRNDLIPRIEKLRNYSLMDAEYLKSLDGEWRRRIELHQLSTVEGWRKTERHLTGNLIS